MYDKYHTLNSITLDGTSIPKHKGILISNPSATAGVTFYFKNISGNTFQSTLIVTTGSNFLPIQVYGMPAALPTGCTAFYLN